MRLANMMGEKYEFGQNERYELLVYSGFLFIFALAFGSVSGVPAQFIVGTAVNAALALSAFYLSGWKSVFPIVLPSVGAYISGLVFGINSAFLLYFIPAIWLGNLFYVALIKKFVVSENHVGKGMLIASACKAGLLFISALVLVGAGVVPQNFLLAMGPMQFMTAICGGAISAGIGVIRKNKFHR